MGHINPPEIVLKCKYIFCAILSHQALQRCATTTNAMRHALMTRSDSTSIRPLVITLGAARRRPGVDGQAFNFSGDDQQF